MKARRILSLAALTAGAASAAAAIWLATAPPPALDRADAHSTLVVDRNGRLLRPFTTPDGVWRLPLKAAEVDPKFLAYPQGLRGPPL